MLVKNIEKFFGIKLLDYQKKALNMSLEKQIIFPRKFGRSDILIIMSKIYGLPIVKYKKKGE